MPGQEEKDVIMRVLELGQLARGKNRAEFERMFAEICNVEEAGAVSSGTAARELKKIELPVIFLMHPRMRVRLLNHDICRGKHVRISAPVGYLDVLALQRSAYRIVTDSGGMQREGGR